MRMYLHSSSRSSFQVRPLTNSYTSWMINTHPHYSLPMSRLQVDKMDRTSLYKDVNKKWDRNIDERVDDPLDRSRTKSIQIGPQSRLHRVLIYNTVGSCCCWLYIVDGLSLSLSCRVILVRHCQTVIGRELTRPVLLLAFRHRWVCVVAKLVVSSHPHSRTPDANRERVEAARLY